MWNNPEGEFVRYKSTFRDSVKADGSSPFAPERDRYHLYVSLACPWAHRTLIMRKLKKLEDVISISIVDPVWNENGWYFSENPGCIPDFVNHQHDLVDVYRMADPKFNGEESVPVLWDKKNKTIVNNESREILRMLDVEFDSLAGAKISLCPRELVNKIDETIDELYPTVNNGVYRAGFATAQRPYERAVTTLFQSLDQWESVLDRQRYLCGNRLTEADICFFTTLFRFDPVYYGHFKCNLRQIRDYPNLWNYVKEIYQMEGIAETCNLDHIKRHYYMSQRPINPSGVYPLGPVIDYSTPHNRDRLSSAG